MESKIKKPRSFKVKALTICQPYAELILRGLKRVENRKWPTGHRGALLIHAGKNRDWLELDPTGTYDEHYGIFLTEMQFGFVVGVCQVRGCIHKNLRSPIRDRLVLEAWPWLADHEHAEGPYCWILEDARRFEHPIPLRGQPGLFDVPARVVEGVLS
jgi:hypothetical protein